MGLGAHTSRCRALAGSAVFACLPWRLGYSSEHHAVLTFLRLVHKTGHDQLKAPALLAPGLFSLVS